ARRPARDARRDGRGAALARRATGSGSAASRTASAARIGLKRRLRSVKPPDAAAGSPQAGLRCEPWDHNVLLPIAIMAVVSGAGASTPLQCATNTRVTEAIAGLTADRSGLADRLSVLAGDSAAAACQLVASLHVVRDTHVAGYRQGQRR